MRKPMLAADQVVNASAEDHCPRDEKNRNCARIYTHVTWLRRK